MMKHRVQFSSFSRDILKEAVNGYTTVDQIKLTTFDST